MTAKLWVPPSATHPHRKAPPPPLGEKFGVGWGHDYHLLTLPGGGVLQFDLSRLTLNDFRQMRDHYQINASMAVLSFMMHQIDWHIECEDSAIADEVEFQIREQWTPLIRGLSQAYWAGYSPMVIQYENDLDRRRVVIDKFKDLTPERHRVHWREIEGYAPAGRVKPKLKVYDGIDYASGVRRASTTPEGDPLRSPADIPVENSLWYPLLMENGDYYGRKLLRPAFPSWFFSILMHLFANRYFERFGEPLPIGRADFEASVEMDGEVLNGRQAMEKVLLNLRNRSVVTLPSTRDPDTKEYDFDLEYLEGQMRGADWERYLARLDEEMSLGLFTPILLFRTADQGSYNLGVGHQQMYMWILNALAGDFKYYLDHYLCSRIVDYNFTPKAPRARFVPRKMGKDSAELFRMVLNTLVGKGVVMPDLQELGQGIGLSLEQVNELVPEADPTDDPRQGRPERSGREEPRGVDEPRDTERQIAARIRNQVGNAFKKGTFGDGYRPDFGFRRQMVEALDGAGFAYPEHAFESWRDSVGRWMEDAMALGGDAYKDSEEFMAMYDKVATDALDRVMES